MPEYRISEAKKAKTGDGYDVTVTVRNNGTGTMPVEVAAVSGERWKSQGGGRQGDLRGQPGRTTTRAEPSTLAAGESKSLTIHCPFAPEKVVVDPDVRVLQLQRKQAVATL